MVVPKKLATPQTSALKKELQTPKKVEKEKKLVESEEDDDDDDDDDELDDDELEDMDDDDDDEEDDDEEDDDDDEEEDDEDDDEDDVEEEEENSGISKGPTLNKSKQTPQKGKTPQKDVKGETPMGPPKMQTPIIGKQSPSPKTGILMAKSPFAKIPVKNEKPERQVLTNQTPSQVTMSAKPIVENAKKRKQEDSENQSSFKKAKITDTHITPENIEMEQKRIRERDKKTLFVRQIPSSITEDEIRSWSPDIVAVRIPSKGRKKQKNTLYGFLEFISEKKAEENYSLLQNKKVNGIEIYVDYAGVKSERYQKEGAPVLPIRPVNKEMLYVTGIPPGATMEDLGKLFPNAIEISIAKGLKSLVNRSAHLCFSTEADAAEAFGRGGNLKIKGNTITVLYAFAKSSRKKMPKRKSRKRPSPQKSKSKSPQSPFMPFVKKEEEESSDGDDNEDSDDNDESD